MLYFVVFVVCCLCDNKMMFNGLMLYGDSDTSDFTKDSIGASSVAGSAASDARSRCLEDQLQATLQILKNKEETVRVQAESLALAEARLAARTRPHPPPPHRTDPLHSTRSSADGCCVETTDVSIATDAQDVDHKMVNTLQDNLSIMEELYRESFFECAQQQAMSEQLRAACVQVRRAEREQAGRVAALQRLVGTQQWALHRCKDIALEVEGLKAEISSFLSSSNNDSGMWERADEPLTSELADELTHISDQLLTLRELLKDECTCGLEKENMKLKRINDTLQIQLGELRQRVSELEAALEDKENVDIRYQNQIEMKECELNAIRQQLEDLEAGSRDHGTTCSTLNVQIQQLQVLLKDRAEELTRVQSQCHEQETTINELRQELDKADNINKENGRVREEVSSLSAQVSQWREQLVDSRRRLHALEDDLLRSREHCQHLERHYREKSQLSSELRAQLEEARERGAQLCGEARRAVCAVRHWMRRQRTRHRDQEQIIAEQEKLIRSLQRHLHSDTDHSNSDIIEPCCSKPVRARRSEACGGGASEMASCSRCPSLGMSASELSSCQSAPTPPRRLRKKPLCVDKRVSRLQCPCTSHREMSSQHPSRGNIATTTSDCCPPARPPREVSPTAELLERVERTHEALADAHRRWTRHT